MLHLSLYKCCNNSHSSHSEVSFWFVYSVFWVIIFCLFVHSKAWPRYKMSVISCNMLWNNDAVTLKHQLLFKVKTDKQKCIRTWTETSLTFPRVDTGTTARSAAIGWFWVVAQSDSFLEALSTGATTRTPFLPVRVASIDCVTEREKRRRRQRFESKK